MRKQRKKCLVLLSITVLLLFTAAFAEKLCPYDPYAQDLSISMKAPNLAHPFGTDRYGRDLLSRVLAGSTVSVFFNAAFDRYSYGTWNSNGTFLWVVRRQAG